MTEQYLRYCQITIGGSTFLCTDDNSIPPVQGLRARFQFTAKPLIAPAQCQILITNPPPERAKPAIEKAIPVKIDAGYQDNHAVLFEGKTLQVLYGRENPTDTLLTCYAHDGGEANNNAVVNTTLPPGSTPRDHLNVALQAMQPFGVTLGFVDPLINLAVPQYPRSVTLWGMARDVLCNIVKSKNALVSYQQEKVTMTTPSSKIGGTVELNSRTGMIGMPTQTTEGIFVRCLINPAIHLHSQIHLNNADIQKGYQPLEGLTTAESGHDRLAMISTDGLYYVYMLETSGDTRGNEWYQDLRCYAQSDPSLSVNDAIRNQGGYATLGPN